MCVEAAVTVGMKAEEGRLMMEAIDGFLILLGKNGRILFASEQVEKHLGIAPVDLMGLGVLEFVHNEDQKELARQFVDGRCSKHENHRNSPTKMDFTDCETTIPESARDRQFFVRMRCHLARPGHKAKHLGHILTQWSGRLQCREASSASNPNGSNCDSNSEVLGMVAVVRPVDTCPIVDIRFDGNVFMSRHDLSMRFTFCDPRILNLVGYYPDELMGKTAYQFHNPVDAFKIHNCHTNLIAKGTSVSKYYRFLGKFGEWIWMKTKATIISNAGEKAQYVVCLNYVYSEEEGRRCLLLEENKQGSKDANVQGYIELDDTSNEETSITTVAELNKINNNDIAFNASIPPPQDISNRSTFTIQSTQQNPFNNDFYNTNLQPAPASNQPLVTSLVTSPCAISEPGKKTSISYPVVPVPIQPGSELPNGFVVTGFPQFVQQNFSDHTPASLLMQDTNNQSSLNDIASASLPNFLGNLSEPVSHSLGSDPVPIPKVQEMATKSSSMKSDYRLAVSDHDYSAKHPDSITDKSLCEFNPDLGLFTDYGGLDDVEMMDTNFLDTVSYGQTNYENNSQNGALNSDSLVGALLSRSGLDLAVDLDDNDSLFESLGETQNGYNRTNLQTTGFSLTEFPSDIMGMYGSSTISDTFASQFAESLLDEQTRDVSLSFGRTDPCMGVTSLQHLATTKTTRNSNSGKKPMGLEQNLNSHTLGLVDTPPPSPKLVRNSFKMQKIQRPNYTRQLATSAVYTPPSSSPPLSVGSNSSNGSGSSNGFTISPPAALGLNKSWPNMGKSSRSRVGVVVGGNHSARQKNNTASHSSRSNRSKSSSSASNGSSLLEQFLTTKQRINPNRGSDNVFKQSRVTERISKLHINRDKCQLNGEDNNLLQQLLTGDIDGKHAHRYEKRSGINRRHRSETNTPLTSPLMSDVELDSGSITPDTPLGNLFDGDSEAEMNSLLGTLSPEVDILMQSELDDILREQTRQEELWHREYVS